MSAIIIIGEVAYMRERGQWRECKAISAGYSVSECSHKWVNHQLSKARRAKVRVLRVRV